MRSRGDGEKGQMQAMAQGQINAKDEGEAGHLTQSLSMGLCSFSIFPRWCRDQSPESGCPRVWRERGGPAFDAQFPAWRGLTLGTLFAADALWALISELSASHQSLQGLSHFPLR